MIDRFTVKGTDYEMGYQIGTHFKHYLNRHISRYEEALKNEDICRRVKHNEELLKKDFERGLDEIYGRADGAGINRDAYLLWLFPEIFSLVDGCTTVTLIDANGRILFSHNEDDRGYSVENVALIRYQYDDCWVVAYGPAEKLAGSSFGFNSHGLLFSSNYIFPDTVNLDYVTRYIMSRDIMNCDSLENCLKRLEEIKVASPFSFNIIDTRNSRAVNVEKDLEEIHVKEIDDRWARSNHFILKEFDVSRCSFNTIFRHQKTKELLDRMDKNSSIEDLADILNYHENDYDRCVYKDPGIFDFRKKSVTVANFSYDGNTGEITIRDYLGKSVIRMKMDDLWEV